MSYVTYVFRTYFGYNQKKAEKLMLEVHHDGKSMVSNGSARRWSATCRPCTSTACGPPSRSREHPMSGFTRHRRSGRIIATFSGFEAEGLRSLAAQLVELLRNEAAAPREHVDPLEAMLSFDGPTTEPDDPGSRPPVPLGVRRGRGGRGRVPALHRGGAPRRQGGRRRDDHRHARGGGAPAAARRATTGDRRRAGPGDGPGLAQVVHRPAPRPGHPVGGRGGRRRLLGGTARRRPRAQAHDIYDWIGLLQETLVEALG